MQLIAMCQRKYKGSNVSFLFILFFLLFSFVSFAGKRYPDPHSTTSFNIKDFGAKGDGKTVDTKAINDAIDAAAKAGGGTVLFPAGTFLSFSIHLKSNI